MNDYTIARILRGISVFAPLPVSYDKYRDSYFRRYDMSRKQGDVREFKSEVQRLASEETEC